MKVIVISATKQQFNGKNYYCGNGRYFRRTTNPRKDGTPAKSFLLHREVWEYHNGNIPKELVVHHKDNNWKNNQIDNLALVTQKENASLVTEETTRKRREHADRIRPLASKWHGSRKGKEFHSELARKTWKKRKTYMMVCEHCDDAYATFFPNRARFCGNNCKAAALRARRKLL